MQILLTSYASFKKLFDYLTLQKNKLLEFEEKNFIYTLLYSKK